jgi:hypothetical protein
VEGEFALFFGFWQIACQRPAPLGPAVCFSSGHFFCQVHAVQAREGFCLFQRQRRIEVIPRDDAAILCTFLAQNSGQLTGIELILRIRTKTYPDGTTEEIYMIYLIFDCVSTNRAITFNDEFQEIIWVQPEALKDMDLNEATRTTFTQKGLI